jgi:hypothetical protein
MFNLSDKELDRLSRKAADEYEVDNNASSWEALEQRLDKELGTSPKQFSPSPKGFRFPFAYTSLIILLVGSGYLLLKSGKNSADIDKKNHSFTNKQQNTDTPFAQASSVSTDKKNKIAVMHNAIAASSDKKISSVKKETNEKTNSLLHIENDEKRNPNPDAAKDKSLLKNAEQGNKVFNSAEKDNSSDDKSLAAKKHYHQTDRSSIGYLSAKNKESIADNTASRNKQSKLIADKNKESKNFNKNAADKSMRNNHYQLTAKIPNNNNTVSKSSQEYIPGYASTSHTLHPIRHFLNTINDSSLRAEATGIKPPDIVHLNKKNNRSFNTNRSLQIGVSTAPDFSEVMHTDYANRLGGSIGITLGYQLLNRLSVNTGLIYARKYYQADDESFHLRNNLSPSGLRIEYVNGSAKMIEIPLNVRYDVNVEGNTIFFVNGGLSSYLMQKQDYLYYCHFYNGFGPAGWYKQDYNRSQNFWFSMINLSAGFETSLSKSISFQVDPYVKIPLKGVGIGNVQLSSYGVNLAFKFSPVLKRSRY